MNISRAARSALGSSAPSSVVALEVTQKAPPPFTFKRRLSTISEVLDERPFSEAAESRFGPSWHSIGRTPQQASAEKQIKSQRKIIYEEADRLAQCNGGNQDAAALELQAQFSKGTSWLVDEFGSPPSEKKRTLTNFVLFLKNKRKKALTPKASGNEGDKD
jgi:hypothetical protein